MNTFRWLTALFLILTLTLSASALQFGSDILNGAGDFDDPGDQLLTTEGGIWSFYQNRGTASFAATYPQSPDYHFYAQETGASGDIRLNGTTSFFANRTYQLTWSHRKVGSSGSAYQYRTSGNSSWQSYTPGFVYHSSSITFNQPDTDVITFNLQMYGDSASGDDGFAIDDVSLQCVRSIPDPNYDSLAGELLPDQQNIVTIYGDLGQTNDYNKAFDPDITVTSYTAVINTVTWISDTEIEVNLTPTYSGPIEITLHNQYSDLSDTYTFNAASAGIPFSLSSDEFPIAVFDVNPNPGYLDNIRLADIGYVHQYALNSDDSVQTNITNSLAYLDTADEAGVKVMMNLRGRKWIPENRLSDLQQIIQAIKNHPALGFWYLLDEPELRSITPSQIQPFYNMIKQETPDIPVAMAHAWNTGYDTYSACEDILMPDHYPVHNEEWPLAPLDNVNAFVDDALDGPDAVMPILQLFNQFSFTGDYDDRYPNTREIRYMSFSTIIQGARGLAWYSYYRCTGFDTYGTTWFTDIFAPVMQEVRQLSLIAAPLHQPTAVLSNGTNNLYLAVWKRDQGVWVMAANGQNTGRQLNLDLNSQISNGYLTPWGMTKPVTKYVDNSPITVQLDPWEVVIWQLRRPADMLQDDYVDVKDLSVLGQQWLQSTDPAN